jgi:hypothetical protein
MRSPRIKFLLNGLPVSLVGARTTEVYQEGLRRNSLFREMGGKTGSTILCLSQV